MKYIYNEKNKELIEKLKTYKLNKADEKQIIGNFLMVNKLTSLMCLLDKNEDDKDQEKYRHKYNRTIIAIVVLTIALVVLGVVSINFLYAGLVDGLATYEKIIFVLLALLFHIILLTILIFIINIDIILKKNILNKLRKNLLNQ